MPYFDIGIFSPNPDKPELNSKTEARNPKQIQMFENGNDQNRLDRHLRWSLGVSVIRSFGFVSDFGFRASDF
jgi:hypothetical protein